MQTKLERRAQLQWVAFTKTCADLAREQGIDSPVLFGGGGGALYLTRLREDGEGYSPQAVASFHPQNGVSVDGGDF